jgi:hypothetical protein
VHQSPPEHDPPSALSEHAEPGLLSQSDPQPDGATPNRPPVILIIVVVLLITGFVVLHLTGVLGPAAH